MLFRSIRLSSCSFVRSLLTITLCACLIYAQQLAFSPSRAAASSSIPPNTVGNKAQPITKPHKEGEMLIKFKHNTPLEVRQQILATFGKEYKDLRTRDQVTRVKIKDGFDLADTLS